jgi:hypothetical protein
MDCRCQILYPDTIDLLLDVILLIATRSLAVLQGDHSRVVQSWRVVTGTGPETWRHLCSNRVSTARLEA